MIVVVVFALASLGGRELWAWWLLKGYRNPINPSTITARAMTKDNKPPIVGRPTPILVDYDFNFSNPKPPPGTTCLVLGSVWFEDVKTGRYVNGYTFDAPLTVGGRESTSGTFFWDAMIPRPGRYSLRYHVYHVVSSQDLRDAGSSGGTGYDFIETPPSTKPPSDPGVEP